MNVVERPNASIEATRLKIVAAIPCFNTGHYIGDIVSKAKEHVDQVIVVDDGSNDGTAKTAKTAGALVIGHVSNRGYGVAINSCFEVAKANGADVLVILDGDGQHNPHEIPQLLAPILRGEADLVIGSRFLTNENNVPRYRKLGIGVITFLWNFGSKLRVSDAQSGFRAYSKKVFKILPVSEEGMSVSIETLEKARREGAIIREIPISCRYGPSALSLKVIRHGLSVAFSVILIRLKNSLGSLTKGNREHRHR